jgi:hypothetical protein
MSNLFARFKGNKEAAGAAKANLFFTDNNVNGYMSKEEFKDYLSGLEVRDFAKFERMFELTNKRFPINNVPIIITDKDDFENVVWLKFKLPNSEQRLRVVCNDNILRFIRDYQEGKFRNGFSLEELILEAGCELAEA